MKHFYQAFHIWQTMSAKSRKSYGNEHKEEVKKVKGIYGIL
jgi:hypothetical protein